MLLKVVPDKKERNSGVNHSKACAVVVVNHCFTSLFGTKHVPVTSTIYHDDWPSYRKLHDFGYKHGVVNHKREFVSEDGVCTSTIEGIWGNTKQLIAAMHGIRAEHTQLILDEFSYR